MTKKEPKNQENECTDLNRDGSRRSFIKTKLCNSGSHFYSYGRDVKGNKLKLLVSNQSASTMIADGWCHFEISSILDHELIVLTANSNGQ